MIPLPYDTSSLLPLDKVQIGDTDYIQKVNQFMDLLEKIARNQQAIADNIQPCD